MMLLVSLVNKKKKKKERRKRRYEFLFRRAIAPQNVVKRRSVGAFEKSSSFPSLALRSFFTVCFCFSALPHAPISVSEVLSSVVKKVSLPYLVAYSVCIPRTHETP